MTHKGLTRAAAVAAATLLLGGAAVPAASAASPAPDCGSAAMVKETLPNGTTWQACWRMDPQSGLVLENVTVASQRYPEAVPVLNSITLAQLNVPYDSGETEYNDITQYGFGGWYLQTLDGADCEGGSAREGSDGGPDGERRKVLCVSAEPSGLAHRLQNYGERPISQQGHDLVLRSISKVGWYEYVTEYRLHDDGQISARLGATGDLSPGDFTRPDRGWPIGPGDSDYSSNHYHSAFWRVDFNIGGSGSEKVEQYDTTVDRESGTAVLKTTGATVDREVSLSNANRRWWRVLSPTSKNKDGHAMSYELEMGANDVYEAHPETKPDVTFTQNRACERFATENADPECADRTTILDFARDREALTDPVMWVRVGFHHVPRDEDQSPMPVHWQGFDLIPRDMTEINRLAPKELTGVNGQG